MEIARLLIVAAVIFGLCYLVDKGITKIFRGKVQHSSGLSVRLNKRYGSIGLIIAVLGIAAILTGIQDSWLHVLCGVVLLLTGAGLVVYYMTFGIFYDEDSFVLTTFGKRSTVYHYREINAQQLYRSYGNILIVELHMKDGRSVQLQSGMKGMYPFLDKAYDAWLIQTGRKPENCTFHDPENSCWFPPLED